MSVQLFSLHVLDNSVRLCLLDRKPSYNQILERRRTFANWSAASKLRTAMATHTEAELPGELFLRVLNHLANHIELQQMCGISRVPRLVSQSAVSDAPASLATLQQQIDGCQRCTLHAKRAHIVFGDGHSHADVMVVGGEPGEHDDRQGLPFVGPAGELLTKILAAIQLTRDDVYMTNIVKCRPSDNRNPEIDEIAACAPFLHQQIACVQPKIICTLGPCAAQTLLRSKVSFSQLRGRFHDYGGIQVMPTYHPAYLLQYPAYKREVWQDMQQVQQVYRTL